MRRPQPPDAIATRYERALLRRAATVHRATLLALAGHLNDAPDPNSDAARAARETARAAGAERRADAVGNIGIVLRTIEALRAVFRGVFAPKVGDVAPIGAQVDLFAAEQLRRALDVPRVKIAASPSILATWEAENVSLIKTIDDRYFDSVEKTILDGYKKGTNTKDLTAAIRDRYAVSQSDARRIARTEVAKLNGKVTEKRQSDLGITEYTWSTSNDERVRRDHAHLNRTVQQWSDPPIVDVKTGRREHPGGDFQCRCVAIPVLPEWARKAPAARTPQAHAPKTR